MHYSWHNHGRHKKGGRIPQKEIDHQVLRLRRFLCKPRTLYDIMRQYRWSQQTALRRMAAAGNVWRVVELKDRTCSYVRILSWEGKTA